MVSPHGFSVHIQAFLAQSPCKSKRKAVESSVSTDVGEGSAGDVHDVTAKRHKISVFFTQFRVVMSSNRSIRIQQIRSATSAPAAALHLDTHMHSHAITPCKGMEMEMEMARMGMARAGMGEMAGMRTLPSRK